MNRIYWLASYPKSGNTWVRIFLTNYLRDSDAPADINRLQGGPIASDRELFDRWAGVESSDLTFEEIADLRPHVYQQMALHIGHPLYIKVHDACTRNGEGELLFPAGVTGGVLYLIRNPLDVAVSYSHHGGQTLGQIVASLCAPNGYVFENPKRLSDQLPQRLLSWSAHVRSWVDESGLPSTVIRYEDLLGQPETAFESVVRTLDLELDVKRLTKAIRHSSFEAIRDQEREAGFQERTMRADTPFFREGHAGGWRAEVPPEMVEQIIATQADIMRRFGYLDDQDHPVF